MEKRSAKYSDAKVREVLRLYHEQKWSQAKIARELGISSVTVGRIVRGESRQDVLREAGYMLEVEQAADVYQGPESPLSVPSPEEIAASLARLGELASETSAADELTSHGGEVIEEFLKKRNAASEAAGEPEIEHDSEDR